VKLERGDHLRQPEDGDRRPGGVGTLLPIIMKGA
jgi:hypothetical protein